MSQNLNSIYFFITKHHIIQFLQKPKCYELFKNEIKKLFF